MEATPRLRIELACERLGADEVVSRCLLLLEGELDDPDFIVTLGGGPATLLLAGGVPRGQDYWLRVWALRGLLWAGPGDNTERLRPAFNDDSWRVREMACKVVARHRLGDLLDEVAALETDPIGRVRTAASRAVVEIVSSLS